MTPRTPPAAAGDRHRLLSPPPLVLRRNDATAATRCECELQRAGVVPSNSPSSNASPAIVAAVAAIRRGAHVPVEARLDLTDVMNVLNLRGGDAANPQAPLDEAEPQVQAPAPAPFRRLHGRAAANPAEDLDHEVAGLTANGAHLIGAVGNRGRLSVRSSRGMSLTMRRSGRYRTAAPAPVRQVRPQLSPVPLPTLRPAGHARFTLSPRVSDHYCQCGGRLLE